MRLRSDSEPTMTAARYEPRDGLAPRVAFVVYNDVHRDARVMRIAKASADAGARVRVFAFGGARVSRYPTGVTGHEDGFEIERVPIRSIGHMLVDAGRVARRVLRRSAPIGDASEPSGAFASVSPVPVSPVSAPEGAAAALPATPRGIKGWAVKQWLRADRTVRQFSFWHSAGRAVRAWKPDLVHVHDANTLPIATRAARSLRIPFVYDSHELWTHRNVSADRPLAKRLEGPMERRGARRAAGVITVSPSIAEWLQQRYSLRERPILVRNIPPLGDRRIERSGGRLHELAGLAHDVRVIVYCGGITFNRGIERVIEAIPCLPDDVHFVLLGEGSEVYVAGLRSLVDRAGGHGRVHFVGAVAQSEVSQALADADVSIALTQPTVLSYEYSLPNKLFESIHAGIPILVSNTRDAAALVNEYDLGGVIAPDASPEALAAALLDVATSADRHRAAALDAARDLTWQQESARLVALHRRVLSADTRNGRTS
ncbi:glycosyltransferase [Microbacterium sp. A82]|uniref:glycosyltransferase n=1 Tax=Microbacterium sp. A82 TaxID=3450452 RepID=UPI003F5ED9A3